MLEAYVEENKDSDETYQIRYKNGKKDAVSQ
jgi:hypothetical protein